MPNAFPIPPPAHLIELEKNGPPTLAVIVDAEEEFDWSQPISSENISVKSMKEQHLGQRIHENYGFRPIYLVDYPVANQPEGYSELKEWIQSGICDVGAQLHTWVTPPLTDTIRPATSYQFNLSDSQEFDKLRILTDAIEQNLGSRPKVHRAGRYGIGARTPELLKRLGYLVDCSVRPGADYRADGGPDFRNFSTSPFWLSTGDVPVLEIPITAHAVGALSRLMQPSTRRKQNVSTFSRLFSGSLARLRMSEQINLTPEGISIGEAKRLVRAMIADGYKVFNLTYHSPSLSPGNTPYVTSKKDLKKFLDWIREFYDFFLEEIGGKPTTCLTIYERMKDNQHESNSRN